VLPDLILGALRARLAILFSDGSLVPTSRGLTALTWLVAWFVPLQVSGAERFTVSASSSGEGFAARGAVDGNRFSTQQTAAWRGATNATQWWWQAEFERPRDVGAILQIVGDHAFVFRNAPREYVWQRSEDGRRWFDLPETAVTNEQRLFRIHRLTKPVKTRFLRLNIAAGAGQAPTLREVEFYSNPREHVSFPDWTVAVNVTHDPTLPNHGQEFIPLAKSCAGWTNLQSQQVWLDAFNENFLRADPLPLCGFLSGSFKDWCEVDRSTWRGVEEVLRYRNFPLWASCGGAQGLAILAETGVDRPWDCPHCRDPQHPKTPIYSHIGHTAQRPCGDYSGCIFERGPHWVRKVTDDPVFKNLPREFQVMESHCGQIEWPPAGWILIATAGPDTKTRTQCIRMNDHPIYAAQFHIEMAGTPEASKQIMANFLEMAKAWGGYAANHGASPTAGKESDAGNSRR
jgi:hypothetical protein